MVISDEGGLRKGHIYVYTFMTSRTHLTKGMVFQQGGLSKEGTTRFNCPVVWGPTYMYVCGYLDITFCRWERGRKWCVHCLRLQGVTSLL